MRIEFTYPKSVLSSNNSEDGVGCINIQNYEDLCFYSWAPNDVDYMCETLRLLLLDKVHMLKTKNSYTIEIAEKVKCCLKTITSFQNDVYDIILCWNKKYDLEVNANFENIENDRNITQKNKNVTFLFNEIMRF